MKDGLVIGFLSVIPRKRTSRAMGWVLRTRPPKFVLRTFLRWYIRHYRVDLTEVEQDVADFDSVVAFFTRALRPGARPVCPDADAVVGPADAKVYACGLAEGGRLPQSPELDYAVQDLLGGDGRYDGGPSAVLYLSPRDYHRVHSPVTGRIIGYRYRPGRLWPVFPAATRKIRDLFARNERLVIRIATEDRGEVAVVMVGAFGVGRMAVTFSDLITNTGGAAHEAELDLPIAAGDELGQFEMGSTVVLVFEPGQAVWETEPGVDVQVGQRIGRATRSPD